MATRLLLLVFLLFSCATTKKDADHRYLKVEKIFRSESDDHRRIEALYDIFGKFQSRSEDEEHEYFNSRKLKTSDFYYGLVKKKDGSLVEFFVHPSEDDKGGLKIERALEIFSHLDLEKSEYWDKRIYHAWVKIIYYKTEDKKFSIEVDFMGRVETIAWSEEEISVPDFSPQPGFSI